MELRPARGHHGAPQDRVPALRLDAHAGDVRDVPWYLGGGAHLPRGEGQGHKAAVRGAGFRPLRVPSGMVESVSGPAAMTWRLIGACVRRYAWSPSSRTPASVTNMTTGAM